MRIVLIVILLQLVFLAYDALNGDGRFSGSIAVVAGMLAGYFVILPALIYYRAKRNFHNAQHKLSEVHYTFTESNYTVKNKLVDATMAWDAVYKIHETRKWFLIYPNEVSAHFLAKAQMTPEQLRDIKALFQQLPLMRKKFL